MLLFFDIFEILTDATGAFDGIFFSSLNILAFLATKDLFFLISKISKIGKSLLKPSFSATGFVIKIL